MNERMSGGSSHSPLRVAIIGCTGRMGRALVRLAMADKTLHLAAAITRPDDPLLGQNAGVLTSGVRTDVTIRAAPSAALPAMCDVAVEFTTPAACCDWAGWCAANGVALVSGTTGLAPEHHAALQAAAERVPVLWAANMSVGVNLLLRLVAETSRVLGEAWDVEIVEAHHRHKADAPSGTAKAILEAAARGRAGAAGFSTLSTQSAAAPPLDVAFGRTQPPHAADSVSPRSAPDASPPAPSVVPRNQDVRPRGQIGVHAVRMGEVIGDHDVFFAGESEVLTLSHRALSRDTFAAGALRAARWLAGRPAGLYSMADVLDIH